MKRKHILVIRFSALGDVAMMVPVVYSLAMQYPDVRITVLSRSFARSFFEDLSPNVNFMEADLKGEYHGVKGLNSLYRRLVAKQFTHVADLHNVLRSEYLRFRFNMGRFRVEHINKHRKLRRRLVSKAKSWQEPLPTSFESYLDVFRRLGFPIDNPSFVSIFPPDGGNLNMLPAAIGPKRSWEHWIGVAPFAAHPGKVYPIEKMEQVLARLLEAYPKARIFLFGRGRDEDQLFPRWVAQMPRCVNVGHYLENMHQELILMSHLDVMLSMDSANMHMASLTGTPVVSVWGATDPRAGFMGWRQQAQNAIGIDLPCRPCSIYGQKPCKRGDYACLNGISPDMILERINQILLTSK
ncbi:MAG: glycosyltransferase family 9 protein [Prevotella sp.]|nr:glycosyltransferase family 9 protein [Prevotella sp.]